MQIHSGIKENEFLYSYASDKIGKTKTKTGKEDLRMQTHGRVLPRRKRMTKAIHISVFACHTLILVYAYVPVSLD